MVEHSKSKSTHVRQNHLVMVVAGVALQLLGDLPERVGGSGSHRDELAFADCDNLSFRVLTLWGKVTCNRRT